MAERAVIKVVTLKWVMHERPINFTRTIQERLLDVLPCCRQVRESRMADRTSIALYAAVERRHLSVLASEGVDLVNDQRVVRFKKLTAGRTVRIVQMAGMNTGRTVKRILDFIP